ncbi:MAG: hypothetical protein HC767_09520 [Akkermansiaceae bacterium]|nr:hypothetical protein [Akkermansiaceae bacterium]
MQGQLRIPFQQPAPLLTGEFGSIGWREEDNGRVPPLSAEAQRAAEVAADVAATAPSSSGSSLDPAKKYVTQEMLMKHTTRDSVWFVHEGKVYDATSYLDDHPGETFCAGKYSTFCHKLRHLLHTRLQHCACI